MGTGVRCLFGCLHAARSDFEESLAKEGNRYVPSSTNAG